MRRFQYPLRLPFVVIFSLLATVACSADRDATAPGANLSSLPRPSTLASFETESGRCDVLFLRDDDAGLQIETEWADGVRRRIELQGHPEARTGVRGWSSTIRDGESLRFGVSMQFRTDGTPETWIREFTGRDWIEVHRQGGADDAAFRESYRASGLEQIWIGESSRAPKADTELVRSLERSAPSLFDNADGDRLLRLLHAAGFVEFLREQMRQRRGFVHKTDDGSPDGGCPTWLSASSGLCAVLKCAVGGIFNPLCHACVGVGIACAIADLRCEYWDGC